MDAFELLTIPDIDAHRTNLNTLIAINAIATVVPALGFTLRTSGFTAVIAIGHIEGLLICQSALNARPGAHISAHLFAHRPCQEISCQCEDSGEPIGGQGRITGKPASSDSRCVMPVENESATGPECDNKPDSMFAQFSRDLVCRPRCFVETHAGRTVTLKGALDPYVEIGPNGLWACVSAPDPTKQGGHKKQQ